MSKVYTIQLQMYLLQLLNSKTRALTHLVKNKSSFSPEVEVLGAEIKVIQEEIRELRYNKSH